MRKFGLLSLILGIVGLTTSLFVIGLLPCIVSLVFGILHIIKIRKSFGKSIAGIACACIGILLSVIMIIAIASPASDSNNDYLDETTIAGMNELTNSSDKDDEYETMPSTENPTTESVSEPSGEDMTEVTTQKPTEKLTVAPTEPQTTKPTVAPTEPQTTKPTVAPTEPQTTKPTVAPTEPQTTKPTVAPTEPQTTSPPSSEILVWIVDNGTRYHCDSSCSNMRSPYQVTIEAAKNKGLTACKRCY